MNNNNNNKLLENFCLKIMTDLKITEDEVKFIFKEGTGKECASYVKAIGDYYKIVMYMGSFNSLNAAYFAAAHELRHVWQYKYNGCGATTLHTQESYDKTYDLNVYELDANRYADVCVYGRHHVINRKHNMYFNSYELDIYIEESIKAGMKVPV